MFTFFFALIEGNNVRQYLSIILPFSKEQEGLFLERFKQVTDSVIFGQFIVGIAQGIIAGIGYFIIGIPNAMLITVLTIIVGILPVIGPAMIWIPVDIYLFLTGQADLGIMLLIYGLFVMSPIDTLMRPILVSEKAQMNSALVLIGMVGGAYAFGFVGFLLGPLIIAALILLIEIYKDKKGNEESILLKEVSSEKTPK
jgi:predicted PurR-regulated permease PerM